MFFPPRACTKELQNQDALNAEYAMTSMQYSGSSSLNPTKRFLASHGHEASWEWVDFDEIE